MEFRRAFTFIFSDRRWLIKLAEAALLVLLCPLPVIGLLCLSALLGYLAALVHNVSSDYPRPLPAWNHLGEHIGKGAHILLAMALYHLPLVLVVAMLYIARETLAVSLFGSLTFAGVLATVMPFLLIYLAFAWALLAIGLVHYADSWDSGDFYQLNRLLHNISSHGLLTLQWLMTSLAASIILLFLLPLAPFLFFPAQGYLAGSFGRRLRAARIQMRDAYARLLPAEPARGLGLLGLEGQAHLQPDENA